MSEPTTPTSSRPTTPEPTTQEPITSPLVEKATKLWGIVLPFLQAIPPYMNKNWKLLTPFPDIKNLPISKSILQYVAWSIIANLGWGWNGNCIHFFTFAAVLHMQKSQEKCD